MSTTDPGEAIEFALAMSERITALGASPVVTDLRGQEAVNRLHRQLIDLLSDGGRGFAQGAEIRSAGMTLGAADDGFWFDTDASGGLVTYNLPNPAVVRSGWNVMLRKRAGNNPVEVGVPTGSLDGETRLHNVGEVLLVVRTSATRFTGVRIAFQPRDNLSAAVDPGVTDDVNSGYGRFSRWANTVGNTLWMLADPSAGAAVWVQLGLALCFGAAVVTQGGLIAEYSGPAFVNDLAFVVTEGGTVV